MKKIFFAIASLALLFTGCQDDETFRTPEEELSSFNQITVTPDILADTRAYINDAKKVVWEQGDSIGVYSDTDGIVPFVYTSGNTFTAAKSVKGTKFYAYYPYSFYPLNRDTTKVENDTLRFVLPRQNFIQTGPNTIIVSNKVVPMVGKSANNQFAFKQIMGMLHFTVKDFAKVNNVVVRTNNNELLNGPSKVDMTADNPVLKIYQPENPEAWRGNPNYNVYLDKTLAEGEVADVYIPVPVGTYANGFTVEIDGADKYGERLTKTMRTDKEVMVKRAGMNSYTEIDFTDADYVAAIQDAMTNAYASFYNGIENQWAAGASWLINNVFGDTTGGDANSGSQQGDQADWADIVNFSFSPNNSYIRTKWNGVYNAVFRANRVMSMISHAKEGLVENPELLIAQAKFIKAVWLFEGIRSFGAAIPYISLEDYQPGVEIPTTVSNVDNTGKYIYIWDKVEQDFKDAINGLPATWEAGNEGRATSWMAKAMLAKLYLYWSSPYNGTNGTADHWADARTLLDDIIANGVNANGQKYALANKYSDLFDENATAGSTESVFDIQALWSLYYGFSNGPIMGWGFYQPTYELANSFIVDNNGLPASNYKEYGVLCTVDGNNVKTDFDTFVDPRLDYCIGRVDVPFWNYNCSPDPWWIRHKQYSGPYVHKKFMPKSSTFFYASGEIRHYHVIRFADILLMRAECAIHDVEYQPALALINQVRARAANAYVVNNQRNKTMDDKVNGAEKHDAASNYRIGLYITPIFDGDELHAVLEREMRAEFGLEGHRWFDLARWGKVANVMNDFRAYEKNLVEGRYPNEYNPKAVTFPIPSGPIAASGGRIVQNENWK